MAHSYVPVDRDQRFLLPPDVREWLPEGHLAWFVIDAVATVDTSVLHARHRNDGVGRRAFDPDMMLGLLIYSYCVGQRSSRRIEQLCEVDVAYRVLSANQRPDHSTIARFRSNHAAAMAQLFIEVLLLCERAGLASVGVVALDGTKVASRGSLSANRRRESIAAAVAEMMDDAEGLDADDDDRLGGGRGDELPAEWARPGSSRLDRLKECLAQIDAEDAAAAGVSAQDEAAADESAAAGRKRPGPKPGGLDPVTEARRDLVRAQVRAQRRRARRQTVEAAAAARGRRPSGPAPDPDIGVRAARAALEAAEARAAEQPETRPAVRGRAGQVRRNTTDPDSRIMKTARGWVQGFNAQAVVNDHQVVIAAHVSQDANDLHQLDPMIAAAAANLAAIGATEPIGIVLADAGYCSEANLTSAGPDRLIATRNRRSRDQPTDQDPTADHLSAIDKMRHRLRRPESQNLYARRASIVEPVFGQIKTNRSCDRFSQTGLTNVNAEWQLITACHNLLKLFTSGHQLA